jgi:hypothetical protein
MMRKMRRKRIGIAGLLLVAAASFVAGCGVRYSDPEPGTEFYESITISGDLTAGMAITVTVDITQTYPVEVESVCELRQNKVTLREIGRDVVPALVGGNPDATPPLSILTHDFTVDEPGTYVIECLTPKDEDNFIAKEIKVSEPTSS